METPSGGNFLVQLKALLQHQLYSVLVASTAFMQLPLPRALSSLMSGRLVPPHVAHSVAYLSVIGILLGALSGGMFVLVNFLVDNTGVAAIVSTGITVFPAYRGLRGQASQKVLAIVAMLAVVFLIRVESLQALADHSIVLVLMASTAFSYFAAGSFTGTHRYQYISERHPPTDPSVMPGRAELLALSFFGMMPAVLLQSLTLLCLLPLLWLIRTLYGLMVIRIHGYTPVSFVQMQQVSETCFLAAVMVALHFAIALPA